MGDCIRCRRPAPCVGAVGILCTAWAHVSVSGCGTDAEPVVVGGCRGAAQWVATDMLPGMAIGI